MNWHALLIALIYGSAIAWFVDVLIERVPGAHSLRMRPRCTHCAAVTPWFQQFPVISWLVLRGRCPACKAPLGRRYPVAELLCIALTYVVAASSLPGSSSLAWLVFVPAAVALLFIDLEHKRLPDALTLPAAAAALALLAGDALFHGLTPLGRALAGAVVLFLVYFAMNLLTRGGMGMGDVKLALSIGALTAYLGWDVTISATLIGFLLAGLVATVLLLSRHTNRKDTIPFGPFMIIGAFAALPLADIVATLLVP